MNIPVTFTLMPYEGLDPLTVESVRSHVVDPKTHKEFLLTEEPSVYPEQLPYPMREILLGRIGTAHINSHEVEVYQLPNDYLRLGSVLNDAVSSNSSRALTFAKGVFSSIGKSFKKIHTVSSLVPMDLSYEDIIIERDVDNFKLLPPVEFVEVADTSAVRTVGEILLDELLVGAGNDARKNRLEEAFSGYWSAIE